MVYAGSLYLPFVVFIVKGRGERRLLALASKERLISILEKMLDEDEFFSDFGIRSYVVVVSLSYQSADLV